MLLDRGSPMEAGAAYWAQWACVDSNCWHHEHPIPAPEYDWEHYGLSAEQITEVRAECPQFAAAIEAERDEYLRMRRSRYRKVF